MRATLRQITLATGLMVCVGVYAQAPANAPVGTTGLCKDGSYHSGPTRKGACANHGGIKDWYAADEAKAAAPVAPAAPAVPAAAPKKEAAAAPKTAPYTPPTTAAVGGGAGKVWVNKSSNVYHCEGTKWYGKTKRGEYMTESAAKAAGAHANHGKACPAPT